ncbi:hypothetical protein SAMN06265365_10571 [Tistlia consotensis]|uniref:Uncharacterized protein n=1 Tax=Tistlia consotensis USBA 355 TaxID=560819 RepID=A0A1Y6BK05_9PROT|nr:hypothetical protein [Tistlia consotensis]SMF14069.1 hypothetical protein SAMN05428998_105227 [Tistlia consotensis USBA 355]SNR49912.1 hypothetical protein SAMN06265365_10571 [Tistlia consotensis]
MSDESIYEAELRAAAGHARDVAARDRLIRTADRLVRDENLDIEELLLLSVAAMALQTPHELESWGRSVARRHGELTAAVEALLENAAGRRPRTMPKALDGGRHD